MIIVVDNNTSANLCELNAYLTSLIECVSYAWVIYERVWEREAKQGGRYKKAVEGSNFTWATPELEKLGSYV